MARAERSNRPSIACPVDFSDASRTALSYAAAIANHFAARLLVMSVEDPLLAAAAETAGLQTLPQQTEEELKRFVASVLPTTADRAASIEFLVPVGKPAAEILRVAQASACDLVVMSSHGRSGISKKFFGSTTERVLRETSTPVLITPPNAPRVTAVADIGRHVHLVVTPVDFTDASAQQVTIAAGIANGLSVPLLLAHVLEPMYLPPRVKLAIPGLDHDRRAAAEQKLEQLKPGESSSSVETLVLAGDASEEIAGVADARRAGLIVMGLHSSGQLGHRMGSVTYRVLCLTRALVLALPPTTGAVARVDVVADPASTIA